VPDDAGEHTVLVAHHDALKRALLSKAALAAGLRDVGEVETFTDLLAMVGLVHPDIVVADRRTPGLGLDEIGELARTAAPGVIVVVTDEPPTAGTIRGAGAVAVATDGDHDSLVEALDRAVVSLSAERGIGAGRRSGEDRRKHQDWSKVTSERRAGDRREDGDRRDGERGPGAGGHVEG
jgi:AmiR/NasT family two-component response regulator